MATEYPSERNYTEETLSFFTSMNELMVRPRTPQEDALTQSILGEIHTDLAKEREEKFRIMRAEIGEIGVEIKTPKLDGRWKTMVLSADPIEFSLIQGEKRTRVSFQPDPNLRFEPHFIYDLFFDRIPNALYDAMGYVTDPSKIKEETKVSVSSESEIEDLSLKTPSGKERLEELMRKPGRVKSVSLKSEALGAEYLLLVPNPDRTSANMQFSFASSIKMTPGLIGLFLALHRDAWKIEEGRETYARSFSKAINTVGETLRTK